MASDTLHEDPEKLGASVTDQHRAIASIMEELEAVDWYNQRAKATADADLRAILEHNRDEEKEHAAMTLEWLRRRDPALSRHLKTFLFSNGQVTGIEATMDAAGDADAPGPAPTGDSLGIGSLRGEVGGR